VLLALDTATQTIGVALHDGSQILAESVWKGGGHHTVALAPETAILLRRAGIEVSSLTALAVALGPGSYTGLRIGMAFAKGLAMVHNLPIVGIPTMDILANSQPRRSEPLLVVIRAGRKRVAGVWYKWGRLGWKAKGDAENMTWSELVERIEKKTYVCGEIDDEGRKALSNLPEAIIAPPAQLLRRPSFLAELAWNVVRKGKLTDPALLKPVYLNPHDRKSE
jgi:tRNA threonylcarbamoyladenosine biosynthesis protein TsaB